MNGRLPDGSERFGSGALRREIGNSTISRLWYEREPDEPDAYDDSLDATFARARLLDPPSPEPDPNEVSAATLQPSNLPHRIGSSGSRRRGRSPRKKGVTGRPPLGEEPRSVPGSIRMTPATAGAMKQIGVNPSTLVEYAMRVIMTGDPSVLLELRVDGEDPGVV